MSEGMPSYEEIQQQQQQVIFKCLQYLVSSRLYMLLFFKSKGNTKKRGYSY